jgi:hypothetical protein
MRGGPPRRTAPDVRSPAGAIAWEYHRKHRWGLAAVALYPVALVTIRLVLGPGGLPTGLDDETKFALAVVVPLSVIFYYLLAVFSFGFAGDVVGRRSIYPARMFTLPVGSAALAGWPMLYGAVTMAALWAVTRLFAPWPHGVTVPAVWPAVLVAALLAWTQALMWASYGLRGLRVLAIVLWLSSLSIVAQIALFYRVSEPRMLVILGPQLPLAFLLAWSAVGRARRGDVRDWRGSFARVPWLVRRRQRHTGFDSPARAQAWLEWRRYGRALPALVAMPLVVVLALLFVARGAPALIMSILAIALLTPPFMAVFVATAVRKAGAADADGHGLTPFMATRPMTSAALIKAKLTMAIRSTLATWLLLAVAIPLGLYASGTAPDVIDVARTVRSALGTPRAVTLVLLLVVALLGATWKQLVQSLYIGLSGRQWAIKGSAFLALVLLTALTPVALWLSEDIGALVTLLDALPWILAVLVACKLSAAAWVATHLYDGGFLGERTLVVGAVGWLVGVLALHGLLVWLVDTPFVASYVLLLAAILAIPVARVAAAPLALAWNRHR